MATRCLPTSDIDSQQQQQPPTHHYTSNTATTQSWPVINRNSYQYDYETLLYLNNIWKDEQQQQLQSSSSFNSGTKSSTQATIYDNINNQNIMQTQTQTGNGGTCSAPPPVVFLLVTLVMTSSATAMLCAAIMTDHWEHVTWDKHSLERMTNTTNNLEWLLDTKVARISIKG